MIPTSEAKAEGVFVRNPDGAGTTAIYQGSRQCTWHGTIEQALKVSLRARTITRMIEIRTTTQRDLQ